MKFTVVFPSHESIDFSYGLVFIPCPVWVQGQAELINLNPNNPEYQLGSVRRLMKREAIPFPVNTGQNKPYVIVIPHENGNGTQADFDRLIEDLRSEGYWVRISRPVKAGEPC